MSVTARLAGVGPATRYARSGQVHIAQPALTEQTAAALRGITGLHVIEEKASVKNGKIDEYRVTMEVTFILEG